LVNSVLWTQHSWGISTAPDILETTDYPCKRYFGLRLEGADADEFVKLVLAPHGDLLFSASPRGRMVGITPEQADREMRKTMDRAITEKKGPAKVRAVRGDGK
jgi:hypothetical protein